MSGGFDYGAGADEMVCAEGKRSIGKMRHNGGDLYYVSMKDCADCPRKGECLTKGEREGQAMARRRVYLSDERKRRIVQGEEGRQWRQEQLRVRSRIEPKLDERMNRHGLRRARYWGLAKVLLNVMVVDLKRATKPIASRCLGPPEAAVAAVRA